MKNDTISQTHHAVDAAQHAGHNAVNAANPADNATARHTPGPWSVSSKRNGAYNIYGCGTTIAFANSVIDREQVSCSQFRSKLVEAEANACLITAAPELLAALKIASEVTERLLGTGRFDSKASLSAIARAQYSRELSERLIARIEKGGAS